MDQAPKAEDLVKWLRKNRELKVTIGKIVFVARRPTDVEALRLQRNGAEFWDVASEFVIGWEGVTEDDVRGGGGTDAVAFDSVLWREWGSDRPQFWAPIAAAVLDAYKQHTEEIAGAAKN